MQQPAYSTSRVGLVWFRIAIIYLIVGIAVGIAMGATQQFSMRPVHAHLNLVGWATGALAGVLYLLFPQAAISKLGKAHFILHNLGVPVMMVSLALVLQGNTAVIPALLAGELATAAGVLAFALNLFVNAGTTAPSSSAQQPQAMSDECPADIMPTTAAVVHVRPAH